MAKKKQKPNSPGCLNKEQTRNRKAKRHQKKLERFAKRKEEKLTSEQEV